MCCCCPRMRNKSNKAATLAQALGSGTSWANRFVPSASTPGEFASALGTGAGVDTENNNADQHARHGHEPNHQQQQQEPFNDLPPAYDEITAQRNPSAQVIPPQLGTKASGPAASVPTSTQQPQLPQLPQQTVVQIDPARSHVRHENYTSITGTYSFYDHLELITTRGSIDIVLDPQPGVVPATLKLESTYGSIRVALSDEYAKRLSKQNSQNNDNNNNNLDAIYSRPWDVIIRSKFGSIDSKLPLGLGSRHFLKSRVGGIQATFYAGANIHPIPINDAFWFSEIKTETHHGSQVIRIEEGSSPSQPMTNIAADFWAKQHGQIRVQYPPSWEGKVTAKTNGSHARVEGRNLQLQHFGQREVHGTRGVGQHMTNLRSDGSGYLEFRC